MRYEFIVDSMLGDLAKWLRILGHSSFYNPVALDDELLQLAANSGAVLVTRDRELYLRALKRGVKAELLQRSPLEEALRRLHEKYGVRLEIDLEASRCPICNGCLRRAYRRDVEGRVPPIVAKKYTVFLVCESCGHVYWPGRHFRNMTSFLDKIRRQQPLQPD